MTLQTSEISNSCVTERCLLQITEKRVSCSQEPAVSEEEIDTIGFKRKKREIITFKVVARDLTQKEWQKVTLAERKSQPK